jgi:adiponectin receptor
MLGAICCLGLSSYYHTCRCISEGLFNKLLCMDKSGVALLIAGSTAPACSYLFACEAVATPRDMIQTLIFVLAIATFICSFNSTWLGPYLFVAMGLAAGAPFYSMHYFDEADLLPNRTDYFFHYFFGGAIYILGAVILVLKVPERFFAVKFDLIGASHNIWHLAVLSGCAWHFASAVRMYVERQ